MTENCRPKEISERCHLQLSNTDEPGRKQSSVLIFHGAQHHKLDASCQMNSLTKAIFKLRAQAISLCSYGGSYATGWLRRSRADLGPWLKAIEDIQLHGMLFKSAGSQGMLSSLLRYDSIAHDEYGLKASSFQHTSTLTCFWHWVG